MFDRRLQVLVDESRLRRLSAAAEERGVSVAVVVREAIDRMLPADGEAKALAGARILAAERMPVPDVDELRRELDDLRGRRA